MIAILLVAGQIQERLHRAKQASANWNFSPHTALQALAFVGVFLTAAHFFVPIKLELVPYGLAIFCQIIHLQLLPHILLARSKFHLLLLTNSGALAFILSSYLLSQRSVISPVQLFLLLEAAILMGVYILSLQGEQKKCQKRRSTAGKTGHS